MSQIAALGIASVITIVFVGVARHYRGQPRGGPPTHAALTVWAVALPLIIPGALGLRFITAHSVLLAVLAGLLLYATAFALSLVLARVMRASPTFIRLAQGAAHAPLRTAVLMIVIAPLCEEFVFRGFLFCLFVRWGIGTAVIATAVLFVVSHRDRAGAPLFALAGILFALLRVSSYGLASPIIAHAVGNALSFVSLANLTRIAPWLADQPAEEASRAVAPETG
ncbi:MAG: CPBP family intramembrane metalloprotease [Candidatus Eremiobacteraeota bacterium]|nr:CPBP family intramembrane metalloprotease [Candidatus Eremiobacteraeota bacterium]MBV8366205.1 CPBP family intramembrane metalloprotease [Candidatus Eremiobacteraeota bacterium]